MVEELLCRVGGGTSGKPNGGVEGEVGAAGRKEDSQGVEKFRNPVTYPRILNWSFPLEPRAVRRAKCEAVP